MITIKKYSNRRLYDTDQSRYITLDELAERIRLGADVRVVDAGSDRDLTQATLVQIVLESRGAARLLPPPLLVAMIRMGDDALADFLGRWMSWALQMYGAARQQAQQVATPFRGGGGAGPFANLFGGRPPWTGGGWPGWGGQPQAGEAWSNPQQAGANWGPPPVAAPNWEEGPQPPQGPPQAPAQDTESAAQSAAPADREPAAAGADDLAALRRELAELRESLLGAVSRPARKSRGKTKADSE